MARYFEVAQARPGQALEIQGTPVRRGESWSDYSLLNRQRSSIGVVALSPVTVLNVARHSFFHLLGDHPLLRERIVTRSATSADRLAQPVLRALVGMEVAALRRELASGPPWVSQ
jgi:CRP-like cAMP-binding protein